MPVNSKLHFDKILSQVSVKYNNTNYLHSQVFPRVAVKQSHDKIRVYDRDFRIPETIRADKAKSREWDFGVTNAAYNLENHALRSTISQQEMDNYDAENLEVVTVEELTDKLMLRAEKSFYDLFTDSSWSLYVSLTAAQAFDATTTANPIAYYDTAGTTIVNNSGIMPNTGVTSRAGFVATKNNTNVLDRVKYTSSDISESMLASLFSLKKYLVSTIGYDLAGYGLPDSITAMFPKYGWVGYVSPTPGPRSPSAGYMFERQTELVKKWSEPELDDATVVEVRKKYQFKIVASLSGYLIKNIAG